MDLNHTPLDLPVSKKENLGDERVIIYTFDKSQHVRLLLSNLAEMQVKGGILTDVTVRNKSNDHEEPFHSMLLAACSVIFQQALTGKHYDCTAGTISLGDITANQFKAFRDFLYKSEPPLDEGMVADLHRFANRYRIDSLAKLCGQRADQRKGEEGTAVWLNHHDGLLTQLHEMFRKTQLATSVLEGSEGSRQFSVHGPLMAAASPVFREMLSSDLFSQDGQNFRLKEVTSDTLGDLIEYIYTGEILVKGENAADLLHAACAYEIPALANACCDWLSSQLCAYNAIGVWQLTCKEDGEYSNDLEQKAKAFIVANFTSVCQEDEFYELEYEDLRIIVQDDDLAVDPEDLFYSVANWVEDDIDNRSAYFCDLLQCIRLENTRLDFLRELAGDPLVKDCTKCLRAVRAAYASTMARGHSIPEVNQRLCDGEDVKRTLLEQFLNSRPEMPTMESTHDDNDCPEEVSKGTPRLTKEGKPDMRYKINRRRLGRTNKDGSPDMRFEVNKTPSNHFSQKNPASSQQKEIPLKKDGTPDRRFKVNKEASKTSPSQASAKVPQYRSDPLKKDGTPDMRFKVNKKSSPSGNLSGPVKRDGTPDMRYAVNNASRRSVSPQTSALRGQSPTLGPLKKDGTPDIRYRANRMADSSSSSSGDSMSSGSSISSSSLSSYSSSSYTTSSSSSGSGYGGPLKSDDTPDMRYAGNKAAYKSPISSGSSGYGSSSSLYGSGHSISSAYGPRKSDGTPDMRYAANKAAYSSPMLSGSSGYSSSTSSYGSGPLKSDGTPDMRYAANKAAYSRPVSYSSSSRSSSSSSFGCGPLKSNGTPDMRFAANRRK